MGEPTRRNLLTTGLWSAPVLAVALAAPSAAASPITRSVLVWNPSAALVPSGTRVDTRLAISNLGSEPIVGPIAVLVSGMYRNGNQAISLTPGSAPGWSSSSFSVNSRTFVWSGALGLGSSTVEVPMSFYQSGSPGVSVITASDPEGEITPATLTITRT